MDSIFVQLAIILGLASALGFIVARFKLPLLIAYLLGGLILAVTAVFDVGSSEVLHFLPEIGIAFVLFLVGMELDVREIRSLGKPIITAGTLQIIITTILGSSIARLFGMGAVESWYLGVGLAFSSTILVIKLLLDKKDITALYGKLAVGILLLEDLLAVVLLVFLTVSTSVLGLGLQQAAPIFTLIVKAILMFILALVLSKHILPSVFKAVSKQSELLFLTALAWCFIYISFAIALGFSVVIGAFLAGVTLASSPFHFHIQGKIKPLRDFFVTLFFVYLGTQVNFADLGKIYPVVILFTAYTLIVKPIIFLLILGAFGFRKHTMFQTALTLTHISEFSLIIILVGLKMGAVSQAALTTIALSGVISMVIASVMITHSYTIAKKLNKFLSFFERDSRHFMEGKRHEEELKDHVVVIGGHKVGGELVKFFNKEKVSHIVLDFNPHHVEKLEKLGVNAMYGDMGDPDVLDDLKLNEAKMVISTAQDLDDNLLLLEELKSRKINIPVVVRGETVPDAQVLYSAGADYVIIPDIIAGDLLAEKLRENLHKDEFFRNRAKIEMEKLIHKTLAWE